MNFILFFFTFLLALIFGWNNSSLCSSWLVSSRIISYKKSILLVFIGFILGALLEGYKMEWPYFQAITINEIYLSIVFFVTLFLLFIATIHKIPTSLSILIVFSLIAVSLFSSLKVNLLTIELLLIWWIVSTLLSILLSRIFTIYSKRIFQTTNIFQEISFHKIGGVLASFYVAYSLGANNIGFLLSFFKTNSYIFLILIIIATILGVYIFSKQIIRSVGENITILSPRQVIISLLSASFMLWISTQLGFISPFSMYVIGAVIGSGTSSRYYMINIKYLKDVLIYWMLTAISSFIFTIAILQFGKLLRIA